MAATTYILLHDEKEIFRHEDEDEVYKKIQKVQGASTSYATTYGGYKVIWWKDDFKPIGATQESRTVVNNFGDTAHNHATATITSIDAPAESGLDKITTIICECGFNALDELRLKKVEDGENASDTSE
jgi:hypothetical protein